MAFSWWSWWSAACSLSWNGLHTRRGGEADGLLTAMGNKNGSSRMREEPYKVPPYFHPGL